MKEKPQPHHQVSTSIEKFNAGYILLAYNDFD